MSFCGLTKGISPKMCILCVRVKINKHSFEPFCVWFLFTITSLAVFVKFMCISCHFCQKIFCTIWRRLQFCVDDLCKMQTSPRSSPRERGSRSPAYPRQDSTGTLKATISLIPGKNPSVTQTGTFYLTKDAPGWLISLSACTAKPKFYMTRKKMTDVICSVLPGI